MTKREYCEQLNKLHAEAVEIRAIYGEFDEKLERAICAIRGAIKALIPEEEQINSDKHRPQRPPRWPEYETPSFKENMEEIKSDKHQPQRWPEYETPSFKENVDAHVCPMCGKTPDKNEKHSCWVCHRCRVHF